MIAPIDLTAPVVCVVSDPDRTYTLPVPAGHMVVSLSQVDGFRLQAAGHPNPTTWRFRLERDEILGRSQLPFILAAIPTDAFPYFLSLTQAAIDNLLRLATEAVAADPIARPACPTVH